MNIYCKLERNAIYNTRRKRGRKAGSHRRLGNAAKPRKARRPPAKLLNFRLPRSPLREVREYVREALARPTVSSGLAPLVGQRERFSATVLEVTSEPYTRWHDEKKCESDQVWFGDVRLHDSEKVLAHRIRMGFGKQFAETVVMAGDVVEFDASVSLCDGGAHYRLYYPTFVERMHCRSLAYQGGLLVRGFR